MGDRTFVVTDEMLPEGESFANESKQDDIITELQTIGSVLATPTSLSNGRVSIAVAGTPEPLGASTPIVGVVLKALRTNTGDIHVGVATVSSTNSFPLERGATVTIIIDDLAKIFVDADVTGETVSYILLTA